MSLANMALRQCVVAHNGTEYNHATPHTLHLRDPKSLRRRSTCCIACTTHTLSHLLEAARNAASSCTSSWRGAAWTGSCGVAGQGRR